MESKPYTFCWKVNKHRQDKRTGAVTKIPQSDWLKYLWNQEVGRAK